MVATADCIRRVWRVRLRLALASTEDCLRVLTRIDGAVVVSSEMWNIQYYQAYSNFLLSEAVVCGIVVGRRLQP